MHFKTEICNIWQDTWCESDIDCTNQCMTTVVNLYTIIGQIIV